jgi:hypothetical protein
MRQNMRGAEGRDMDSRASPALAAASVRVLHSPDTMRSIAAPTFFESAWARPGERSARAGRAQQRRAWPAWGRDVFHAPPSALWPGGATHHGLAMTLGSPPVRPGISWLQVPVDRPHAMPARSKLNSNREQFKGSLIGLTSAWRCRAQGTPGWEQAPLHREFC